MENKSTKKLLFLSVLAVSFLFLAMWLRGRNVLGTKTAVDSPEDSNIEQEQTSVFASISEPLFFRPVQLTISSISLSAPIVEVGVTEEGQLETPESWDEIGWFTGGAEAGEHDRNVILNGHFDKVGGAPAVLYNLSKVQLGDIVEIKDYYGRIFNYEVVKSTYVDINDPNRLDVFNDIHGKATLTLVTCGGVWTAEGYNKRLVISAELTLLDNIN